MRRRQASHPADVLIKVQMQYAARRGFFLILPATKSSNGSEAPPKVPPGWLVTETR